jgi:hypothetical protein
MAATTLAQNFFDRHRGRIAFAGPDDCWLWTGGKNNRGYGRVGPRGDIRQVHRLAFEASNGENSAHGFVVRHRCDVPLCVNPAHLQIGTHADNVRDKVLRGRQSKGEARPSSKLTENCVRTIRSEYVPRSRDFGQYALARRFGVHQSIISEVIRYGRWKHI